jgi:hypothetical protein
LFHIIHIEEVESQSQEGINYWFDRSNSEIPGFGLTANVESTILRTLYYVMICRFSFSSAECCELQYKEMWWFVFPLPVKIQDVINDEEQATSKLYYPQPVKFICTNLVSAHTTTKQIAVFYWIVFYSVKAATISEKHLTQIILESCKKSCTAIVLKNLSCRAVKQLKLSGKA